MVHSVHACVAKRKSPSSSGPGGSRVDQDGEMTKFDGISYAGNGLEMVNARLGSSSSFTNHDGAGTWPCTLLAGRDAWLRSEDNGKIPSQASHEAKQLSFRPHDSRGLELMGTKVNQVPWTVRTYRLSYSFQVFGLSDLECLQTKFTVRIVTRKR